jgi:hypothetical protein
MRRIGLAVIFVTILVLLLLPAVAHAGPVNAGPPGSPVAVNDPGPLVFSTSANHGFGDWQNAYPWSMATFNGDLYVGTGRLVDTSAVMQLMGGMMGSMTGAPSGGTLPPSMSSFLEQTAGGAFVTDSAKYAQWEAVSRAEVWRLHNGHWSRVYQSPLVPALLRDKGTGLYSYTAAQFMGFRSMAVLTDSEGQTALYASSGGFSFAAQAPLLLRSLDGIHWNPVATPAGMGRETRALGVHNGNLYVGTDGGATNMFPVPAGVWCSNDPDDLASWHMVLAFSSLDNTNTAVTSFASFNNLLYVGTENKNGFQIWRSKTASPSSNSSFMRVVTGGAGSSLNAWAGTMKVFKGDLYAGSMSIPGVTGSMAMKGFDLIRIHTSDTWDLVVGDARTLPGHTAQTKPLSLWPSGFANPLNLYCWSLQEFNGQLYLGTFDVSIMLKLAQQAGIPMSLPGVPDAVVKVLLAEAGADLWKSSDGRWWWPVTLKGFGDQYCYGVRNMVVYNNKLYLGMSNPFFGCKIIKGSPLLP